MKSAYVQYLTTPCLFKKELSSASLWKRSCFFSNKGLYDQGPSLLKTDATLQAMHASSTSRAKRTSMRIIWLRESMQLLRQSVNEHKTNLLLKRHKRFFVEKQIFYETYIYNKIEIIFILNLLQKKFLSSYRTLKEKFTASTFGSKYMLCQSEAVGGLCDSTIFENKEHLHYLKT